MTAWKNYHRPTSVEEAIAVLQSYDGHARVIGGGTDLLVESRRGLRRPFEAIVDASGIAGLNTISYSPSYIEIGCGVTHTQIVSDDRINQYGTCLAESCGVIGGPQVRNAGTMPATLPTRCLRATAP